MLSAEKNDRNTWLRQNMVAASKPDSEIPLLFKLLPEKYNAQEEKIYAATDIYVLYDRFPGLFHFPAPMYIIKN